MTDHHEALARQAVEQFRQSLSHEAREYVTNAQFEDLEQLILELLASERGHIVDLVEALARTLRSGVEKPDLEL
jgi:predicted house-cleaning noncanonical NTP pyrophosphatase (MazG superfamily)